MIPAHVVVVKNTKSVMELMSKKYFALSEK